MKTDKDKLKIKTITSHDVYNFGASLQTFALMQYLKELGHDVEIIDYRPAHADFDLWAIGEKWDKNFVLRILYFTYVVPKRLMLHKRRKKFDIFTKSKLSLTSKSYRSNEDLKKNTPSADLYFAGSDQIWNPLLPNGKDPSFFLNFVGSDAVKASYAASFAVNEIPLDLVDYYKNLLDRLDFISVRESSALEILKGLDITKAEVVLDPVFLLPHSKWKELSTDYAGEKYIFVYDQENSSLIKNAAKKLAKKYNLKIYAIESLYPMRYADRKIKDADPLDFLGLIENAEICLTNSFHCIAFSIIFNKKFYLFKRAHLKVNSRMLDMLSYLGLSYLMIEEESSDLNLDEISYKMVVEKVDNRIQTSKQYINTVISYAQSRLDKA